MSWCCLLFSNNNRVNDYAFNFHEEGAFLGQGSYGKVYKVTRISDKLNCAGKFLERKLTDMRATDQLSVKTELKALKETANHPFLIKLIGTFEYKEKLCIVTNYASGGDLEKLIT